MDRIPNPDFAELNQLVEGFKRVKILVIGDLMLDEYIWGEVERISPEAPVPVVRVASESWVPGGAANVAHNIRALGGQVALAGVIGRDQAGVARGHQPYPERGRHPRISVTPGRPADQHP
jgi:bifunctional ADP-heptose synthase (sugar kinase/adenylyltransferase)